MENPLTVPDYMQPSQVVIPVIQLEKIYTACNRAYLNTKTRFIYNQLELGGISRNSNLPKGDSNVQTRLWCTRPFNMLSCLYIWGPFISTFDNTSVPYTRYNFVMFLTVVLCYVSSLNPVFILFYFVSNVCD